METELLSESNIEDSHERNFGTNKFRPNMKATYENIIIYEKFTNN